MQKRLSEIPRKTAKRIRQEKWLERYESFGHQTTLTELPVTHTTTLIIRQAGARVLSSLLAGLRAI